MFEQEHKISLDLIERSRDIFKDPKVTKITITRDGCGVGRKP